MSHENDLSTVQNNRKLVVQLSREKAVNTKQQKVSSEAAKK